MRKFIVGLMVAAAAIVPMSEASASSVETATAESASEALAPTHQGAWQYEVLAPAGTWGQYSYWLCKDISIQRIYDLRVSGHYVRVQWICTKVFGTHWQTLLYYRHL